MANYFSKFPKTWYGQNDQSYLDRVTNIISRYAIEKNIRENLSYYLDYTIRDGDTPEIIAYKIYGSPERHWLILAANDIIDVQEQWPLTYEQLNNYINEKYFNKGDGSELSGLEWAKNQVHTYYKTETTIVPGTKITKTIKKFEVDANTYANTVLVPMTSQDYTLKDGTTITVQKSKETKTYYEYEYEENENKRNIKILNFQYVDQVENELQRVFQDETQNQR